MHTHTFSRRFQKHVDNTARDGRRLTVLCYLNPDWDPQDGGKLRVLECGSSAVDVAPVGGRLAIFYADKMPHEVLAATGMRHALTVWYYDKQERAEAIRRAPKAPEKEDQSHIKSRQEVSGEAQAPGSPHQEQKQKQQN
eukprot:FR743197.1.p2 GENE.FR743197.1~~FR743197.1.p2  ORF type:complete len:139 (+),score=14.88 FR743197.1:29-445(+)